VITPPETKVLRHSLLQIVVGSPPLEKTGVGAARIALTVRPSSWRDGIGWSTRVPHAARPPHVRDSASARPLASARDAAPATLLYSLRSAQAASSVDPATYFAARPWPGGLGARRCPPATQVRDARKLAAAGLGPGEQPSATPAGNTLHLSTTSQQQQQ
jgi:hypothetical protein